MGFAFHLNLPSFGQKLHHHCSSDHSFILITFYNKVTCLGDVGCAVVIVYLDFSKALKMVSHRLFLEKLKHYRLDKWCVQWWGSWLSPVGSPRDQYWAEHCLMSS